MVQFLPLDVTSEESVGLILSHIDNCIQYGEAEVRIFVHLHRCLHAFADLP